MTNIIFLDFDGVMDTASYDMYLVANNLPGKTGADWDSAPEQTGTLLMLQS